VLFAVGDTITWDQPAPRVASTGPLAARFVKIAAADADSVPFIYDEGRRRILDAYLKLSAPKALAAGPMGAIEYAFGGSSADDIIRRVLQICAERARSACLLVAVNDDAVTRVPKLMRAQGLLDIEAESGLPAAARQELIAASADNPWYALARGAGGILGVGASKAGEGEAMDAALGLCRAQGAGTGCAISAVGPYLVRPK
jgi:hypothetical protein